MTTFTRLICGAVLGAASLGGGSIASAAEVCPSGTIKMIVPNPAGGIGDLIARTMAERVSADLGQPVVVENEQAPQP